MEEFRYFEAIQRKREEKFTLVSFMQEKDGEIDVIKLVKSVGFFSEAGKLAASETTELLESRKLTKGEMAVFTKIVEAVAQSNKLTSRSKRKTRIKPNLLTRKKAHKIIWVRP